MFPFSQQLETGNEDKIPDYAEIEERTDSEGIFHSDVHHRLKGYYDEKTFGRNLCHNLSVYSRFSLLVRLLCTVDRGTGNEKAAAYFCKVRGN